MEELVVPPGELLIHKGQSGDALAYVVSGELEVRSATGAVVGSVGPGELVGEAALFARRNRQATVVAKRESHLVLVTADAYADLRGGRHPAARNVERAVLRQQLARMRAVGDRIATHAGRLPGDGPGP